MYRETFYNLTIEGHQELMLATIEEIKKKLDDLREQCEKQEEFMINRDTSEAMAVLEAIEEEEGSAEWELVRARDRLIKLRGFDEIGLPF